MSEETLDRLAGLADAATAGPWEHRTESGVRETNDPADTGEWEVIVEPRHPNVILASELEVADAEFVCAARTWLPDLIDDVRRLR